jgi:hypothetical protein
MENSIPIFWDNILNIIIGSSRFFDENWRKRMRKIDTKFLIVFIMKIVYSKSEAGYQTILYEIWNDLKNSNLLPSQKTPFAASSVCDARQKLDAEIIKDLSINIAFEFLDLRRTNYQWFGRNIFSTDGSNIHLPPELKVQGYTQMSPKTHYPQGKLSCLYHVGSGVILDTILDAVGNERVIAKKHLTHLLEGDVVIYDRGYYSYELAVYHIKMGIDAVFRVGKGNNCKEIESFVNDKNKPKEKYITIVPSQETKSKIKKEYPNFIFLSCKMRIIRYIINDTEYFLATTILDENITILDFQELYHERWAIEEHYKLEKTIMNIEKFHSKTENGVRQELYAAMLLINLTRILASEINIITNEIDSPNLKKKNLLNYATKTVAYLVTKARRNVKN